MTIFKFIFLLIGMYVVEQLIPFGSYINAFVVLVALYNLVDK